MVPPGGRNRRHPSIHVSTMKHTHEEKSNMNRRSLFKSGRGLVLLVALVLGLAFSASPMLANTCDVNVTAGTSIQDGINNATAGQTVCVAPGAYVGNLSITRNIKLISTRGRDNTTIEGVSGQGSLGAIVVPNSTTGVQIGDTDQGFTIIGIDNGSPGIENAAIYFKGGHSNVIICGNAIVANGDLGLLTEYGAAITGFLIDNNVFSGNTFVGENPAGEGFSGMMDKVINSHWQMYLANWL